MLRFPEQRWAACSCILPFFSPSQLTRKVADIYLVMKPVEAANGEDGQGRAAYAGAAKSKVGTYLNPESDDVLRIHAQRRRTPSRPRHR